MPPAPSPTDTATLRKVRGRILRWYRGDHRDFPWRASTDPYPVLVSEVMLQQTQASRVIARFPRFVHRFPSAAALARATEADVLVEWSGLGYNRRALSLRQAAPSVNRNGWPRDVPGLERLPGIGPYTARAIASLAFGAQVGVVDTNVRRWLIRRFPPGGTALQALADALAVSGRPTTDWTHASMEFGARVCTARRPHCESCPLRRGCPSLEAPARVPVRKQPSFAGSSRALRGAVVRAVAAATHADRGARQRRPGLTASALASRTGHPVDSVASVLPSLVRDGLVHVAGARIRLGRRDPTVRHIARRGALPRLESARELPGRVRQA
ncbi:MAG: A/G-specific adenine glycosylase [Chloroflexi bacterium]|nr:MAG: A/G-specific adenine glycosylase [Chloroflexota bacterium]